MLSESLLTTKQSMVKAASALQPFLPIDIVMNNIGELPVHTLDFNWEDDRIM